MDKTKAFKLKLIYPNLFMDYKPCIRIYANYLPYGMGVLTNSLRKQNYHVEQEDLLIAYNNYRHKLNIFNNILLNYSKGYDSLGSFLDSGEMNSRMSAYIDRILNATSVDGFDMVGFSVFSYLQFEFALMLAQRLKIRANNAIIVIGGPFISILGHLFYSKIFKSVDYIITADGRVPLLKLIKYLQGENSLEEAPNLIYKYNNRVIKNPSEFYPIEDMPIPDFDGLPIKRYSPLMKNENIILPYQISRGCASRCSFCTHPDNSHGLEFKSHAKVLHELKEMKERYVSRRFIFCDELINNSYEYLDKLCGLFIKHRLNIYWEASVKVGNLDNNILSKMKEAGCKMLYFGIESGSDKILKGMNKGFNIETANRTIRTASKAGLRVTVSLIAGYPHETREDIAKTVEFIKNNKKYIESVFVHRFFLYYNSLIYRHPESYRIENVSLLINGPNNTVCRFDETNGLKWDKKNKQINNSNWQILKAVYFNLTPNKIYELIILACFCLFYLIAVKINRKIKLFFKALAFNYFIV